MSPLQRSSRAFEAKLSQPQLWLLSLLYRKRCELTTADLRKAPGAAVFGRAVLSYSIKALAKRGLLRRDNEERKISRIKITTLGRRLLERLT